MTPADQSSFDQAASTLADSLPPFWHRMYRNLQEAGFNEADALKVLQSYILSQCPFGVNGTRT